MLGSMVTCETFGLGKFIYWWKMFMNVLILVFNQSRPSKICLKTKKQLSERLGKWYTIHLYLLHVSKDCDSSSRVCPRRIVWRLTFPVVSVAPMSILLCVPLLSHLSLPSRQSPPSLAPALLMIPRQETELAWGSKVIFPPFLCRVLLFVTAFHWNFHA